MPEGTTSKEMTTVLNLTVTSGAILVDFSTIPNSSHSLGAETIELGITAITKSSSFAEFDFPKFWPRN